MTPKKGNEMNYFPKNKNNQLLDSVRKTQIAHFDTYACPDTNQTNRIFTLNPYIDKFEGSGKKSVINLYSISPSKCDGYNFNDMFLRTTMSKLEETESQNSYLTMQKKFVKKALTELTDQLCEEKGNTLIYYFLGPKERPKHHKTRSEFSNLGKDQF